MKNILLDQNEFEKTKQALQAFLDKEWNEVEINQTKKERFLKFRMLHVRKNAQEIILHTDNQILLSFGTKCIVKTVPSKIIYNTKTEEWLGRNELENYIFTSNYQTKTPIVPLCLKELNIPHVEHHYLGMKSDNNRLKITETYQEKVPPLVFAINPDLSENNSYEVKEFNITNISTLENQKLIKEEFEYYLNFFMTMYEKKHPTHNLNFERHVTEESPKKAIQHMFFIRNKIGENVGELLLGDLDHTIVSNYHTMQKYFELVGRKKRKSTD